MRITEGTRKQRGSVIGSDLAWACNYTDSSIRRVFPLGNKPKLDSSACVHVLTLVSKLLWLFVRPILYQNESAIDDSQAFHKSFENFVFKVGLQSNFNVSQFFVYGCVPYAPKSLHTNFQRPIISNE